jgi:translation initiation factor IF-2
VILKAGEAGSLEALSHIFGRVAKDEKIEIVDKSPGNIHEGDVKLAASTDAIIFGFRVKADKAAENTARMQNITIVTSEIIYELEKNLEEFLLKRKGKEKRVIEVLAVFGNLKNRKQVVGGRVTAGPVKNLEKFEVFQDEIPIGEGKILNLQSGKKNVATAEEGAETGLLVEVSTEIKPGNRLIFK